MRKHFLFVGNSQTYSGDIPKQIQTIARVHGIEISYFPILHGGAMLSEMKDEAIAQIQKNKYDFIVMQEACNFIGYLDESLEVIRTLCIEAKSNDTIPILYNPYASEPAEIEKMGGHINLDLCKWAYELIAINNNAIYINASEAWEYAHNKNPDIVLTSDGSHPNDAGAFLTACIFLSTLFDLHITKIPADNQYKGVDAIVLAQSAWEFVSYYKATGKAPELNDVGNSMLPFHGTWKGTLHHAESGKSIEIKYIWNFFTQSNRKIAFLSCIFSDIQKFNNCYNIILLPEMKGDCLVIKVHNQTLEFSFRNNQLNCSYAKDERTLETIFYKTSDTPFVDIEKVNKVDNNLN